MRDEHDGAFLALPQAQQLLVEPVARDLVERAERLVHHQELGLEAERARDRDALLHAARQLPRVLGLEAGQADALEVLEGDASRPGLVEAMDLERQADVGEHGAPRKQRRRLEHIAVGAGEASVARRKTVHAHAARRDLLEVGDHAQQRRLAAARGTDQGNELAFLDRQADIGQRRDGVLLGGIDDRDALDFDRGGSSRRGQGVRHSHAPGCSDAWSSWRRHPPPCGRCAYRPRPASRRTS